MKKNISIIGYGRFGKILHAMLQPYANICVYDSDCRDSSATLINDNELVLRTIYNSDAVFYCVPISQFSQVIKKHRNFITEKVLLVDTLSVKMHPATVLKKALKNINFRAMLTHPLFGPDSCQQGFTGHKIVVDKFLADDNEYNYWCDVFERCGLKVIELNPKQHDSFAADSQGLTHFIGRILSVYGQKQLSIDTVGAVKLNEIREQTCNDSWQLFNDLQAYNPFTKFMRQRVETAYEEVHSRLLSASDDSRHNVIGIQGGRGSFNEQAVQEYIRTSNLAKYKVKYLYTTRRVLEEINGGQIEFGQFALHNSVGGIVDESLYAMADFKFKIVAEYRIKIAHALMIHKDAKMENIDKVMSHPQVFAQCKDTLLKKYCCLPQVSGQGDMVDHAKVACSLSQRKLPISTAVIGSSILAQIYDLHIVDDNLQDDKNNYTSFVLVTRK